MKKFLIAAIMSVAVWSPVVAADSLPKGSLPVKALQPYDLATCGVYFGVNTIGTAGGVNAANGAAPVAPGTQVVQGGLGATVGYGCPIGPATAAGQSFWFVEGMADAMNLNGSSNGLSLGGPASFTERFGVGSPINSLLGSILPVGTQSPAVPNLPLLPAGITAGPSAPYMFLALHQTDVSASFGLGTAREWLFSYGVGLGVRSRLSNGVVADTFAEFQAAPTSSLCVGPAGGSACAKFGNKAMVGFALLY